MGMSLDMFRIAHSGLVVWNMAAVLLESMMELQGIMIAEKRCQVPVVVGEG